MATHCETKKNTEIRIFETVDELSMDLAEYISQLSEISVKERGCFTIAISGGPIISLISKLCEAPYHKMLDWSKWYVFWADERAVSKTHSESNYKITKEKLLSKVPILNSHVYSLNDALTVEDAASEYEFSVRQLVKARIIDVSSSQDCPKFDLILLSLGPSGQIASLYPSHPSLSNSDEWITFVTDCPEPPPERITFTLPVINSAGNVGIVGIGEDKKRVLEGVLGEGEEKAGPVGMVSLVEGKLVWFLDKEAGEGVMEGGKDDFAPPTF
ncbi:hypothetical protein LUZ60_006464 [Juncus effusus]|nr:hypothetical protein LUZ60_006464 [Juncus effusus]